jgi:hypothetical protein
MGKVFKSAKKIVKKAAPVIGMAAGFALAGPLGVSMATAMGVGAGLGGLAGGYGVKNSLMMGMGGYGLGSLASGVSMFGLQNVLADPTLLTGGQGFFGGIPSLISKTGGSIMNLGRGLTGQGNFLGGPQSLADTGAMTTQQLKSAWETPAQSGSPYKGGLLGGLFNKLNTPIGVLGATTALGYLGAKQAPDVDPIAQARKLEAEYQSPVDIKYGTKFSGYPGQKVKGLFYNPETKQFQDTPYAVAAAQGGVMSIQDFPRKQGQISGPGTATSDSVPALLSDGEFVMTADAVRGIGDGSRREGAKKMYNLMNQFEKRAVA